MCFYVNLRELWPFKSAFARPSNKGNEKRTASSRNKSGDGASFNNNGDSSNNNNNNNGINKEQTDVVNGKFCRWNERELAPHWLTKSELLTHKTRETTAIADSKAETVSVGKDGAPAEANTHKTDQRTRHYETNLLANLAKYGQAQLSVDAGGGLLGGKATETTKITTGTATTTTTTTTTQTTTTNNNEALVSRPRSGPSSNEALTSHSSTRNTSTMSGQKQAFQANAINSNEASQLQNVNSNNSSANQQARPETQQCQQEQQQLQYQDHPVDLPEPSQQALAEAAKFRVRTARRRHLDFDAEYSLDDLEAPQRSKWSGPFHFIQAADCQFGMIDSYVHHKPQPGWREEIELCERLVELCHRMQPKPLFMIICGDLVDSLPASEIGRRQVVDFKRIFAKLEPTIPLVCVCGNHDVGDQPTSKTINDYRQTFGEDYFYFTKNDLLFIVINSQFYQNRDQVQEEAREQDLWLENILTKCRLFKYSIIFEHIPWFLEEAHEENDYFNIRKEVRMEWLRKFAAAGVTKIMCGHYHRNAGGWFGEMELVVTSAIGAQIGSDKSGIRIVRVLDKSIEHQYYAMEDVPSVIELN